MSREEAVARTLSRVPVFAVANQEGLPYLTETTKEGKRTGSIYLGLREAVALLEAVRVYDVNATLAVVPLASIFSTAAKSSAELERQVAASVETSRRLAGQHSQQADELPHPLASSGASEAWLGAMLAELWWALLSTQVASAPQPEASGSTDMRLFRLRPLADETPEVARELTSVPGSIPLFWEPNLFITVEGEQRRPYFFRVADLEATWARQPGRKLTYLPGSINADTEAARPSVRVVGIERLLAQLECGETYVEPILMPASETAELVKGRTLGNKVSQPRE